MSGFCERRVFLLLVVVCAAVVAICAGTMTGCSTMNRSHLLPADQMPIGLEGVPVYGEPTGWDLADELQMDFATYWMSWDGTTPFTYSWSTLPDEDEFKQLLVELKKRGYRVMLSDTTVLMTHRHVPADLADKRFNDPELVDAWQRNLEDVLARYGDETDFFSIGAEVEIHLGDKPDEWKDYLTLVQRGSETIRRLRPGIKVGVMFQADIDNLDQYWQDVEAYCDFLAVNYYLSNNATGEAPASAALDPGSPHYFGTKLDRAIRIAGDKPVIISEVGCGTHPEIESSPEAQAQFIRQFFQWLRGKEHNVLAVQWFKGRDWNRDDLRRKLTGQLSDWFLDDDLMMKWITSLGLAYEDGREKPGLAAFKEEVRRYRSE